MATSRQPRPVEPEPGAALLTAPEAAATRQFQTSVLEDMLALLARPGLVSLALGLPDPGLFPVREWMRAATRVAETNPLAFQYGPPDPALKRQIVALMAQRGVVCGEGQVVVTTGAQQGLSLLAQLLLRPGGVALVEEYTYPNFRLILRHCGASIRTVATDAGTGLDVSALEDALSGGLRPSLLYVMSDGHNPLGVSLSARARVHLVRLAREYRLPIIEDDAYGLLAYETAVPPLRALDDEWVFYTGSFSKILAPGVRIGWVVVPERLAVALATLKEASDINTATFNHRVTTAYLDTGNLHAHLTRVRTEYRRRRDALLDAVTTSFPPGTRWTRPASGVFAWVELPAGINTTALLRVAVEQENVAFVPGEACRTVADGHGTNCLRLNFSNARPEVIEDGIRRLSRVMGR